VKRSLIAVERHGQAPDYNTRGALPHHNETRRKQRVKSSNSNGSVPACIIGKVDSTDQLRATPRTNWKSCRIRPEEQPT
jgi:hypothetical protein